jgi:hypothetical protein
MVENVAAHSTARHRRSWPWPAIVVATFALVAVRCDLDPVHDDAVADLGGEAPGIPPGPFHRPGQPCLVCHDGSTAKPAMSVAGTVYAVLGNGEPIPGATVLITAEDGATFLATTNAAGNFYVEQAAWQPVFPLRAAVAYGGLTSTMSTIIGRDGSCATCHVDPPSRISAGRVYLAPSRSLLPEGGTP